MLSTWDPAQYGRFERERLQPAHDLLARVPLSAPNAIYDLGCGTGNATAPIAAGLRPAYPPRGDGRPLFPFRRLFIVAFR